MKPHKNIFNLKEIKIKKMMRRKKSKVAFKDKKQQ